MDNIRLIADDANAEAPCCQCGAVGQFWDRLAERPYCPDCEEALARGEGEPLVARVESRRCCVCDQPGTVSYRTLPLRSGLLVLDLCRDHFRDLLARKLDPIAFAQLRRRLTKVGVNVEQIFLLHDAFYDKEGQALQPVGE
ncbi:MAG TPA: hypothetical protein VKD72_09695 [Gemmataceae bacterium]|nr:hypothetical protein [Gemmataceae bacterium]